MSLYRKDLDEQLANALTTELHIQTERAFEKVIETNWRLTQHNFLINAGGAAAVLAYLGTSHGAKFAVWPLLLFLVGVIASGAEVRALVAIYSELHKDALNRLSGFMNNLLPADKAVPSEDVAKVPGTIKRWGGWIAQLSFVLGVIVGLYQYLCYLP